jgi:16S rRNA (uracil1498-N3)-methyltransferase
MMAAPRFFVPSPLTGRRPGEMIELDDAVAHHATRVTRLQPGDEMTLFDGTGGEFAVTLERVDKRGAAVQLQRFVAIERESALDVTLAQVIAANDAMDYAVRKATELGVTAVRPLLTARSARLPAGERSERRVAHWRQVAIAACEQCGRNRVPEVLAPMSIDAWLTEWQGPGIVLLPAANRSLASLAQPEAPLAILIGPEGGFEPREVRLALAKNFQSVRLGPRVLRTETAAAAAVAVMQALWGDFK